MKFLLFFIFVSTVYATELKLRPLAQRSGECKLCHIKRETREAYIPKKNVTQREHFEIVISHGSLKKACNDCHDVNNSNFLLSPGTFENTSALCSRCHIERYREWQNGFHGKKITSWKNNVAFQCIDCHDPHSVSFKKMESKPAPKLRLYEEKKPE
jgi:nitrate/TMAO reductase-like tetraheme cytochrome c subunit